MADPGHQPSHNTTCLDLPINDEHTTNLTALSLVGRLLTTKRINFKVVTAVLQTAWNLGQNVAIKNLDNNTVSCTFTKYADRDRILKQGPWAIKGAILNLILWPPSLTLHELNFAHCSFWVHIHNLPLNWMNASNATIIGSTIGPIIKLDDNSQYTQAQSFLRAQILVDTTQPLKTGCFINRENGSKLWLAFRYERLSDFCYICGCIDHTESSCTHKVADDDVDDPCNQFGPWLRV